jgi:hypothetical protein
MKIFRNFIKHITANIKPPACDRPQPIHFSELNEPARPVRRRQPDGRFKDGRYPVGLNILLAGND